MIDRKLYEIIKEILGESSLKKYPEEFSTRVIIQKILYLLTHGASSPKINLSYNWNFYLYGPYSPEIAQMIYHMNDVWEEISNKVVELDRFELKCIEHFKEFKKNLNRIQEKDRDLSKLTDSELFEVLATLVYFAGHISENEGKIQEKFSTFKPELCKKMSKESFNQIFSLLSKYAYI